MIDPQQLALVYGPLGLVIAFLLHAHRDLVYKTIPEALAEIKKENQAVNCAIRKLANAVRGTCRGDCGPTPAKKRKSPRSREKKPPKTPQKKRRKAP